MHMIGWLRIVIGIALFFFLADDGIRDGRVTGVQTCALPVWICPRSFLIEGHKDDRGQILINNMVDVVEVAEAHGWEIGRASCRERADRSDGVVVVRRDKPRNGATSDRQIPRKGHETRSNAAD